VKKKAELETLRQQVSSLEMENRRLKEIASQKLPNQICGRLLQNCSITLPDNVSVAIQTLSNRSSSALSAVMSKLATANRCFYIFSLDDGRSIIFASPLLVEMTKYNMDEIVGKRWSFLHGPETNPSDVSKIYYTLFP
jgi:PAS domain-containing protein